MTIPSMSWSIPQNLSGCGGKTTTPSFYMENRGKKPVAMSHSNRYPRFAFSVGEKTAKFPPVHPSYSVAYARIFVQTFPGKMVGFPFPKRLLSSKKAAKNAALKRFRLLLVFPRPLNLHRFHLLFGDVVFLSVICPINGRGS